jgi:hypothetical protein
MGNDIDEVIDGGQCSSLASPVLDQSGLATFKQARRNRASDNVAANDDQ